VHAIAENSQVAQVPCVGPIDDPLSHNPVFEHQPQPAFAAQSPQLALKLHRSGGAASG
jgi:hypothetical protein